MSNSHVTGSLLCYGDYLAEIVTPYGLSHLKQVMQRRTWAFSDVSPCFCFSSPHTMFSLWPPYGQSHFLKKQVLCKCAPYPHLYPNLSSVTQVASLDVKKGLGGLSILHNEASPPSMEVVKWLLWQSRQIISGGRASLLLTSPSFNTERSNGVLSPTLGGKPARGCIYM